MALTRRTGCSVIITRDSEAANIILLTYANIGVRNGLLRGVKKIICVDFGSNVKFGAF